jgi:DNA-binding transcriptional MerR regulator|tara:strand:- start:227 stop:451 length:225 start_codon:yes stop_codon:yes gene_type:complete
MVVLSYSIGQLTQNANTGVETIRVHERLGFVPEPPRTPSGYRRSPPGAMERLRFIQGAKRLGFSLNEMGKLLAP